MKNIVECWKDFFAYFNALETNSANIIKRAPFCLGLAIFDILCLVSFILNAGMEFWLSYTPVYYPVTWPIHQIAHTGNTLCTVLLCVKR